MKTLLPFALSILILSCDQKSATTSTSPTPPAKETPPAKTVTQPAPPVQPPPTKTTAEPTTSGSAGKTAVSVSYACPVAGCKYTSGKRETCLTHPETNLKERWYACSMGCEEKPEPGKCGKCGMELQVKLK